MHAQSNITLLHKVTIVPVLFRLAVCSTYVQAQDFDITPPYLPILSRQSSCSFWMSPCRVCSNFVVSLAAGVAQWDNYEYTISGLCLSTIQLGIWEFRQTFQLFFKVLLSLKCAHSKYFCCIIYDFLLKIILRCTSDVCSTANTSIWKSNVICPNYI